MSAFFACALAKLAQRILRLLNKGGTALPGTLALKICPDILRILAEDVTVLAVTGTNGKTTSARIAEKALLNAGLPVFSNRSGANMTGGIAAELIANTDLFLRPKCRYAVLECDEGYTPALFAALKPKVCLLTNLFRDQTDRYGSLHNVQDALVNALAASPETVLCVNADCPAAVRVALRADNPHIYFGAASGGRRSPDTTEDTGCPVCGRDLRYRWVSYSDLGSYFCPSCGFERPDPELTAEAITDDGIVISLHNKKIAAENLLSGTHNAYNVLGVTAAVSALGVDITFAADAASDFERGFGRAERFPLGKRGVQMILVKNTAAVNQSLDIIGRCPEPVTAVFIQNANAGDGRDLSWLHDADFERLRRMRNVKRLICSGDCAGELTERLGAAGLDCECIRDYGELISELEREENEVFLLPSYTAMLQIRKMLVHRTGGVRFWE